MQSGTIHFCIVSRVYLGSFKGDGITSQVEGYYSIYCLVFYCDILICRVCLYFIFIINFVTEVLKRPSGQDSP